MIGPKERYSRREGVNLFLKGARSVSVKEGWTKRQTRPGQHGTRLPKFSSYARQLREKQKVKRIYGMREKQFRRFYAIAVKTAKNSSQDKGFVLLQLLERRLDNVLYACGLAKSKSTARQMVVHKHVMLNGKRTQSPSILVNEGDQIAVSPKVYEKLKVDYKGLQVAEWIEVNGNVAKVTALPVREQIDQSIKESLIVELYSR